MPAPDPACWPLAAVQSPLGDRITVRVGAPGGLAAPLDAGLQLVVEADPSHAQRCRAAWPEHPGLLVCDQVLAAQSDAPVRWCLFNDARLNGPLDQQAWQAAYPNICQIGVEERLGCSLADLLTNVGRHLPHGPTTGLALQLQQGDPLAALDGLGAWLQGLQTVQLSMPAAVTAHWAPQVAAWLEPRGFRASEGAAACWQRDAIASQRLLVQERDQALAHVQELEVCIQQLSAEREALQAQNQQQQQQLEHILRELDAIQALLDQELASVE